MSKISIHQGPYYRNSCKNKIVTVLPIRKQNASKNPGNSMKHTKWFVIESFIHSFFIYAFMHTFVLTRAHVHPVLGGKMKCFQPSHCPQGRLQFLGGLLPNNYGI